MVKSTDVKDEHLLYIDDISVAELVLNVVVLIYLREEHSDKKNEKEVTLLVSNLEKSKDSMELHE